MKRAAGPRCQTNERKAFYNLVRWWPSPIAVAFVAGLGAQTHANVSEIVQRSAQVTEADRRANSQYDYSETDRSEGGSKTYSVRMLFGSPYQELTASDGKPLPPDQRKDEQRKLKEEIAKRQRESPDERAHRIAEYRKEEQRDLRFIREFSQAFNFRLAGSGQVNGHPVYIVRAVPRQGFHPTDKESEVLTGMRGTLYVDKTTYHWVRAEADVVHPVSIEGFLAKVEPGTRFELDKMPVDKGVWLPSHFVMRSNAKILGFVSRKRQADETYFDYHKAQPAETGSETQQ